MEVSILYVTSDDSMPFAVMEGDVPFSHLIEVENAGGNCRFSLHAGLEQLSAAMIDSEEIEVKAGVSLKAFVAREEKGLFPDRRSGKRAGSRQNPGNAGYCGVSCPGGRHALGHRALLPHDAGKNP